MCCRIILNHNPVLEFYSKSMIGVRVECRVLRELLHQKQPELSISNASITKDGLMAKLDKKLLDELPEITISDTAPQNPKEGDLWFDDDDAVLSVYYVDVNGVGAWMGVSSDDAGIADIVSTTAALKVDKTDDTQTKLSIEKVIEVINKADKYRISFINSKDYETYSELNKKIFEN